MKFEGIPQSEPAPDKPEPKKEKPAKPERLSKQELIDRKDDELSVIIESMSGQETKTAETILSRRIGSLKYADQQDLAESLVGVGWYSLVIGAMGRFSDLSQVEIAEMIIEDGGSWDVVDYLDKFSAANHSKIAELIMSDDPGVVIDHFKEFKKISDITVKELLDYEDGAIAVARRLDKFPNLDRNLVVEKLFNRDQEDVIFQNWRKFAGLNKEKLIQRLLARNPELLVRNIDKFEAPLHKKIVAKAIEERVGYAVADSIHKLKGVDLKALAFQFINSGDYGSLGRNIKSFPISLRKDLIEKIRASGHGYVLLDAPAGALPAEVCRELARELVKEGNFSYLAERRAALGEDLVRGLINKAIEDKKDDPAAAAGILADGFMAFERLSAERARLLANNEFGHIVMENLGKFDLPEQERIELIIQASNIPREVAVRVGRSEYAAEFIKGFSQYTEHYQKKMIKLAELQTQAMTADGRPDRVKFQRSLLEFGRNKQLTDRIKESGIDIEKWLNFDERESFKAGAAKRDPIESAKIPMVRIVRDINHVSIKIRLVQGEMAELIKTIQFPESPEEKSEREGGVEETRKQIEAIKSRIGSVPPERRAGMDKALVGLSGKLEKLSAPKERNSEDVLNGSLTNFRGAKKSLFEKIKKFYRLRSGELGVEEEKAAGILRDEIFQSADQMGRRYEELTGIMKRINEASAQDIFNVERIAGEEADHLKQDVNQIKVAFAKSEKAQGSRFSIGVWNRDLKEDLFLGNYTDCCIRTDSTYQGANLPLADYLADLGIQVVVVRDEVRNQPVYAAWCWLGGNPDGESAVVIDNIEGHPSFANRYRGVMKEKIVDYVKKYAKTIGVDKVVLGPNNNDIDIRDFKTDASGEDYNGNPKYYGYEKIGGQADSLRGKVYYLEALGRSPILLVEQIKNKPKGKK